MRTNAHPCLQVLCLVLPTKWTRPEKAFLPAARDAFLPLKEETLQPFPQESIYLSN
jgi:hypothetical protein